jgi:hypothetical protein
MPPTPGLLKLVYQACLSSLFIKHVAARFFAYFDAVSLHGVG